MRVHENRKNYKVAGTLDQPDHIHWMRVSGIGLKARLWSANLKT